MPNKLDATQMTGVTPIVNGGTGLSTVTVGTGNIGNAASTALVATPVQVLLAYKVGVNMNTTNDQALTLSATVPASGSRVIIENVIVTNASISLTTAAGGFYTAASKGGTAVVAAGQAYSSLDAATKFLKCTVTVNATASGLSTLYLALTSAQGQAATADVYVTGYIFPAA